VFKSLVYFIELHLMRVWARFRGLPLDALPKYTSAQKRALNGAARALWGDWWRVSRENRSARELPRIWLHLRRYFAVLGDLAPFLVRKRAERSNEIPGDLVPSGQPDYYLRNYHYQTDGYFSRASALRYDHQIELLFLGVGHQIRKVGFELAKTRLPAQAEVLEIGAGTGTSGHQFKTIFPDARLTLLEPSAAYLEYARETYPGRFEATRVGFAENFDERERYDCVFSCFVLHEIPRRHWEVAIGSMRRALKAGGLLLIVDSRQNGDDPEIEFALDLFEKDFFEPYYGEYRREELASFLERQGFEMLAARNVLFSKSWLARKL